MRLWSRSCVAVIVEGGQVSDGRQNICGPWFEPEELRRAAEAYGDIEPEEPPTAEPPPAPDEGPPERSPVDPPPAVPGPAPESASFLARLLHFFLLMLRILGRG